MIERVEGVVSAAEQTVGDTAAIVERAESTVARTVDVVAGAAGLIDRLPLLRRRGESELAS
jgi:sensor domain CHASE-containing protein